jgi:hypothetical protein
MASSSRPLASKDSDSNLSRVSASLLKNIPRSESSTLRPAVSGPMPVMSPIASASLAFLAASNSAEVGMSAVPPAVPSSSKSMSSQLTSSGVLSTAVDDSLVIDSALPPEVGLVVDSEVTLLGYPSHPPAGQASKLLGQFYHLECGTVLEPLAVRLLHGKQPL